MPDDLGSAGPGGQPIPPGTGALIGAGRTPGAALEASDYAGFWNRVAAAIIDFIVTSVGSGLILGPIFLFFVLSDRGELGDPDGMQTLLPVIQGVSQVVSLFGGWLYFALMESSRFQGTLGKMAVQIKVTDLEGNRISFGRATGRHFGKIVSGIILLIGYIMVAFTERKQGLHDMMAGCLVVRK
ncbi:MAG: RDD family protein [Acidobacteria bacterium]|nr:RDD family protein [Acidobacteriota bacterium]